MSTPDFTGSGRPHRREADPASHGYGRGEDSERYGLGSRAARPGAGGYGDRGRGASGNGYSRRDSVSRGNGASRRTSDALGSDYGRRGDYGRPDDDERGYGRPGEASRRGGRSPGPRGRDERGYGRRTAGGYGDGYGRPDDDGHGYGPDEGGRLRRGASGAGSRLRGRRSGRDGYAEYGPGGGGSGNGGGRGRKGNGGKGGKPPKRKGSWWRHWSWKKVVGVFFSVIGLIIVGVAITVVIDYNSTPIPTDVTALAMQQASTVYFNDGKTVVGTFGTTNRQVLSSSQIPSQLKYAVLAAEDRNFYNEGGVSFTGILRAAYEDTLGGGNTLQGGSTITQQFVRNYYDNIGTQQTIGRKLKEIYVSIKLAHVKSKDWILTQYLNTIYFGDGAYGVGAAAETFFGEPASKLNVSQDAMIAAMLNAPGQFDPTPGSAGYKPLVARWQYVLQGMVTMGKLTQAEASAQKFPKVVSSHSASSGWTGYNGYIMQDVLAELESTYHYSLSQIDNGGLHIVTTFSKPLMDALYHTVGQEERAMRAAGPGDGLPWFAHVGAVLEQPGTGAILAMYSGPSYSEPSAYCKKIFCQVDMALGNREQVGSSFKPYVLAAARAQGMSVKTSILDGTSPLCVPSDQYPTQFSQPANGTSCPSTPYGWHMFSNDEGDGAQGPQTVVNATAQSLNTAYTDLTHRVGTQNVINMAKAFGVNTGNYPNGSNLQADVGQVGIALGQNALTVGEQASTFATLAANGEYSTPHVIKDIMVGTNLVQAKVIHRQVLTPDEAADVDYALSQTTISGTGTKAEMSDGRPMIGKTGTTSTAQSAFFLGAIPQYSFTVGIFTNQQNASTAAGAQTLNNLGGLGGYGGDWPALIWHAFAQKQFLQLPVQNFPAPTFGGTQWNLMGQVPVQHKKPNPAPTHTPSPHPTNTCGNGNQQQKGCHTSPPPTSPPPTSPPPTCKNPNKCHTGTPTPPLVAQGGSNSGTGNTSTSGRLVATDPARQAASPGVMQNRIVSADP
ncbi:MAG TPA: transglycosylase domain-containing protein [Streptosporangiaceae bacterium]|nr:transglycosylase domain-containing protein [Streptosporangiaceae bacterium]